MKSPSRSSKCKVAVRLKRNVVKCDKCGNVSVGGSGDGPVWENRVKNETRKVFGTGLWEDLNGLKHFGVLLLVGSHGIFVLRNGKCRREMTRSGSSLE